MVSIMFELMLMVCGDMSLWIINFLKTMAEALVPDLSTIPSLSFGFLSLKKLMLKSTTVMTVLKHACLDSII